mmetsp:Transcript_11274/g.26127  ORF Transcript_11274/g.26127 Transcript_11274/m.26127 type:complete len:230 (-) Transcript_11274:416-1105(-)
MAQSVPNPFHTGLGGHVKPHQGHVIFGWAMQYRDPFMTSGLGGIDAVQNDTLMPTSSTGTPQRFLFPQYVLVDVEYHITFGCRLLTFRGTLGQPVGKGSLSGSRQPHQQDTHRDSLPGSSPSSECFRLYFSGLPRRSGYLLYGRFVSKLVALFEIYWRPLLIDSLFFQGTSRPMPIGTTRNKIRPNQLYTVLQPFAIVGVINAEHNPLDWSTVVAKDRKCVEQRQHVIL